MKIINSLKNIYHLSRLSGTELLNSLKLNKPHYRSSNSFVNSSNLDSKTSFLVWVDKSNFKVNIYTGSKNNWKLLNSYPCSIGKPSTPTPEGTFTVKDKGYSFGENHGYICYYYTRFLGNYLFHSILYNLYGSIKDGRLGMKISNGCVRLAKINAKWIYDNVPFGTTVFIN